MINSKKNIRKNRGLFNFDLATDKFELVGTTKIRINEIKIESDKKIKILNHQEI